MAGYLVDELISRGGMGIVHRVTSVALNQTYALKVLSPELSDDAEFRQGFKREMQIAGSLNHPNSVGIHYAGEQDGLLFLVMDFVSGTDVREVPRSSGPLETTRAVRLLVQVASAKGATARHCRVHGTGTDHR